MAFDYSLNKIHLWAEISLPVPLAPVVVEITYAELTYGLDSIPRATLHCAVGRETESLLPANIHNFVDSLRTVLPIVVFGQAEEVSRSGPTGGHWPIGPFIAFSGRLVGTAYTRARAGSAKLSLHCTHFLAGLEFSWIPNRITHALNPGNNHMNCGIRLQAGNPHFIVSTLSKELFTQANILDDYWHFSLRPWLQSIANQRQIFDNELVNQGNDDAIITLNFFEPFLNPQINQFVYEFGVPMSMRNFDVLGNAAGIAALAQDSANETLRSIAGVSFWDKIVADFGARYMFKVVPMANRALIAPVVPGLRFNWAIIDADEYDAINLNAYLPRPVRGIVLETDAISLTGARGLHKGGGQDIKSIGGVFENPLLPEGMIHFRQAPAWLANAIAQTAFARGAAGIGGVKGNAMAGPIGVAPALPAPAALRDMAKVLWDEYARVMYLHEVFQHRRGSLSGRVRFDIAPGSTVTVITTEEKFITAQTGNFAQALTGLVTQVSIVIDSDTAQGYTAIELSHLRSESEMLDDNLAVNTHPIWSTIFLGAPLINEPLLID